MFSFVLFTLFNYSYAKDHGNGIVIHKHNYPKMEMQWNTTPSIIVCSDSPYTKETVVKAVNIWKREGVKIGDVLLENEQNKCNFISGKKNFIQIAGYHGNFNQKEYYAFTWDWPIYSGSTQKRSSKIEFATDTSRYNLKLLVHELGHTLGYDHYDHKYDIMNR